MGSDQRESGMNFPVYPSVGVEEEFLLVDPATGQPQMRNAEVVSTATELGVPLQLELSQCQVETNSPVCWDSQGLRRHLLAMRATAADAAARNGSRLLAAGTPPLGPSRMPVSDSERYRRMARRFGTLALEQGICGCHVHVDVHDRETGVQVCNHVRSWLPALLALSANSPLHRGADSGYSSWRTILWSRWPVSGPPPLFASAERYDSFVAMLVDSGSLLDERMIYWDIRPSSHLPTVEVRVGDVMPTVDQTVLLATLVRALVMTATRSVERGDMPPDVGLETLRVANWIAARDGLTGEGLDPRTSSPVPYARQLELLLDHVHDALDELGEFPWVESALKHQLAHGNGAVWQRRRLASSHSVEEVVRSATERTLLSCGPQPAT
ncbi:carboxylate-amine ligase [Rhodococcus maanshanensis]|uniref:Putative glutamate--cysteine ligase 2 n=1 Tax=Rhodococcus maanshanensis TaxID=183556 RepID=A0A1H7FTX5_9NOCA|nr:glutamate--cysteine ligase [Rhodococcus maanshanensis]SEK29428.1 carboxylate-amine ligase [Rhodococcus maanshanensis]